jgi:hypothetical protein
MLRLTPAYTQLPHAVGARNSFAQRAFSVLRYGFGTRGPKLSGKGVMWGESIRLFRASSIACGHAGETSRQDGGTAAGAVELIRRMDADMAVIEERAAQKSIQVAAVGATMRGGRRLCLQVCATAECCGKTCRMCSHGVREIGEPRQLDKGLPLLAIMSTTSWKESVGERAAT